MDCDGGSESSSDDEIINDIDKIFKYEQTIRELKKENEELKRKCFLTNITKPTKMVAETRDSSTPTSSKLQPNITTKNDDGDARVTLTRVLALRLNLVLKIKYFNITFSKMLNFYFRKYKDMSS